MDGARLTRMISRGRCTARAITGTGSTGHWLARSESQVVHQRITNLATHRHLCWLGCLSPPLLAWLLAAETQCRVAADHPETKAIAGGSPANHRLLSATDSDPRDRCRCHKEHNIGTAGSQDDQRHWLTRRHRCRLSSLPLRLSADHPVTKAVHNEEQKVAYDQLLIWRWSTGR